MSTRSKTEQTDAQEDIQEADIKKEIEIETET
jgi:hypothetical protein